MNKMTKPASQRAKNPDLFEAITQNISVQVKAFFLEDQSNPDEGSYLWGYSINITNQGDASVQLLTRHWVITDANGLTQEVRGDGVVGDQPHIAPGATYNYSSGSQLAADNGFMRGSYGMVNNKGESFKVEIPAFSLDSPIHAHQIN